MKSFPRKIHIVGNSGAGKTTLAKHLSDKLQIQHVDLDDVLYQPGNSDRLTGKKLKPHLDKILANDNWIVEGIYLKEVDLLFKNADQIIWLDIRMSVALWRITKRHLRDTIKGQEKRGHRNFIKFFRYVHKGYKDDPKNISFTKKLKPFQKKLIQIRNRHDLQLYLKNLNATSNQK